MSDDVRETPGPDAPRDDWREVVEALNALGESIGRATRAAVDDDENRRRLRELRGGLEALALRLGESSGRVAPPEGMRVQEAVVEAATTAGEAATAVAASSERVVEDVRPEMVNAFRQATAKFKQAADTYDKPASGGVPPMAPTPGVPAAVLAAAWSAPAPSFAPVPTPAVPAPVEPAAGAGDVTVMASDTAAAVPVHADEPAAPAPVADAGQLAPDLLQAVRATNDRFQAERKAAVEAAAALAAATAFLPPEPEPEHAAEPATEPEHAADILMQDDAAGPSVHEGLDSPMGGGAAETPPVSFDPWATSQSDPATGEPNAPAPEQPGLFEFTDEGEDETQPARGIDFDFREVEEGSAGTGGGYTP